MECFCGQLQTYCHYIWDAATELPAGVKQDMVAFTGSLRVDAEPSVVLFVKRVLLGWCRVLAWGRMGNAQSVAFFYTYLLCCCVQVKTFHDTDFLKTLELAIQYGFPFLFEGCDEYIDPIIDPVLERSLVGAPGSKQVRRRFLRKHPVS